MEELPFSAPENQGEGQPIVELGSTLIQSRRGTIYVLTIVGQVEGHQVLPPSSKSTKYEHVMPLLALVGSIAEDAGVAYELGVTAMFSIDRSAQDFREYASRSAVYYQRTLEDALRLIKAVQ